MILSICCYTYYEIPPAILENYLVKSSSLSLLLMAIKIHPPPKCLVGPDVIQQQGCCDTHS